MGHYYVSCVGYGMSWANFCKWINLQKTMETHPGEHLWNVRQSALRGELLCPVSDLPFTASEMFCFREQEYLHLDYSFTGTPDTTDHVVFYPADPRREWFNGTKEALETIPNPEKAWKILAGYEIVEFERGFCCWKDLRMTPDGVALGSIDALDEQTRRMSVPMVPLEIRFYLTRLGILYPEGVNLLRPMAVGWWT